MDTRHQKRTEIVQDLFAYTFLPKDNALPNGNETTSDIIDNLARIDGVISEHASKFPIDKIAKIDLAILRLAVYELTVKPLEPQKVVVNEAVELAKELGGEKSYSFINGVLGKLMKQA